MPPRRKQVTYSRRPNHAARAAHARGERQFRKYDTSYIRPKRKAAPIVLTVILAIVVIGGLGFGTFYLFNSCSASSVNLLAEGEEATVVVEDGSGARDIGQSLVEARLVPTAAEFTKRVNELGVDGELKPGTYTFSGGTSLDDIIRTLQAGPDQGNALTVPEGYTLDQIAAGVAEASQGRISAEDFLAAASDASVYAADYAFLADAGTNKLEGFLFPKTYAIADDATADSVVRMMLDQFRTETAGLDYSYATDRGLSLYDAVKLASIVEKESSGEDDTRKKVAAVFYNRLTTEGDPAYGMIGSDATTAYEIGGDPAEYDWNTDSPYNTRKNPGLPPTPICSPSLSCLQAVCDPAPDFGDYYFFSFWPNDSGGTDYFFDKTYDDHLATVAAHS